MKNKYIPAFLWIENYRSIKDQGFHFTSKYVYTYDSDKQELKRKKNENYIEAFFGENINITAIVGANGSGKTTVLTAIMELFSFSNERYIIAFENGTVWKTENENIFYYKFDENSDTIKFCSENIQGSYSYFETKPPISCVYYSQAMDWTQYLNNNDSIINLSSGSLLDYSERANRVANNSISNGVFFKMEFYKQLKFIESINDDTEKTIGFKLPEYVNVNLVRYDVNRVINPLTDFVVNCINNRVIDIKKDLCLKEYSKKKSVSLATLYRQFFSKNDKKIIKEYIEYIVNIFVNRGDTDELHEDFINKITVIVFCGFCNSFEVKMDSEISFEYLLRNLSIVSLDYNCDKSNCWQLLGKLIKSVCSEIEALTYERYEEEQKMVRSFLEFYNYINDKLLKNITNGYLFDDISFRIPIKNMTTSDETPFHVVFDEFLDKYNLISEYCNVFEFSWGLSSGEIARIELYSRLYDAATNKRWQKGEYKVLYKKENSILLLIDEADMLLHPEWQRKFISDILKTLPKIFKEQFINVIIATHSPIMLSDIPKQSVLYLVKDNKNSNNEMQPETFGSNIFKLYNNAFFMEKGAIGLFAKEKLEDLLKDILDGNGEKNNLQQRINFIGDDFLRSNFQSQFDSIYKISLDEEIAVLEKKIQELKKFREENINLNISESEEGEEDND